MGSNLQTYIRRNWMSIVLYGLLFVFLGGLLFWQLGSLTGGYAAEESASVQATTSLAELLKNPLNAPYYLLVKALSYLVPDTLLATRIASTGLGALSLILFCWLVKQWHGPRTAILTTLLFGSSAIFLHTARLGTPDVLMLGLFMLIACGFWIKSRRSPLMLLLAFLLVAILLYVPGMIWLVVIGAAWQWRALDRAFKQRLGVVSIGAALFLAALAPLGWAFYKNMDLIKPWLGIPEPLPNIVEIGRHIVEVPMQLFIRHLPDPLYWLGTLSVFDVFTTVIFLLGGWRLLANIKLARTQLLVVILAISTVLIGLQSSITLPVLIPFMYLIVAVGINYLIREWYAVFPRNPIAKTLGMGLLSITIALACGYHLRHYFVGWPQTSATEAVFTVNKDTSATIEQ